MAEVDPDQSAFDHQILTFYPYPIAVGYRRILEGKDARARVEAALAVFEYGLRAIALGLLSQYLIRDAAYVTDRKLNALLLEHLPHATLGTWKRILFDTLRAYKDHRMRFFMPELYDLYWDISQGTPRPRRGIQEPYDRLISIRNDLAHQPKPTTTAAWQALEDAILPNLRIVLEQFSFIQNYSLVRVVEQNTTLYTHTYTGEFIKITQTPLPAAADLKSGWFYLSKANQEFLLLHPLLIFWEVPPTSDVVTRFTSDAALYDTFTKNMVTYIDIALGELIKERALAEDFSRLLYETIEREKQERLEAHQLTWELLNYVAGHIAAQRFQSVRAKYDPRLYSQRELIKTSFEEFLSSDKTAFLLLGRSGVGKSSFFLSLADEYQARDQLCLLLYDGANLDTERPLAQLIGRDFDAHIQLRADVGEIGFSNLLGELSRIEGIERRQIILFIDAINENADARALLRRIDALVADNLYPWFKVVFSSRPEAWRAMKRGVKLTEHRYYRVEGKEELGVEIHPFSIVEEAQILGVKMEPFTKEELPEAYRKYQTVYHFQTEYQDLSRELREILNDPLTLKLVAETYAGQVIPARLQPGDIYQHYIERMITDERLDRTDVRFLEDGLMPLMIAEDSYAKAVEAGQLRTATLDGHSLFEMIHSDERLSNGRAINQSFQNLANAEILVLRGTPTEYEVGFKYERFYDYYGGKRIAALAAQHPDRAVFFGAMINRTIAQPFLWGPVKSALVAELKAHGPDRVRPLCYTEDQRVKEMMAQVLTEWGWDDQAKVEALIRQIVPLAPRPSSIQTIWRFVRKPSTEVPVKTRNAYKIAIEVAGNLDIRWVLEEAALQADPTIRVAAVRHTFFLWQRDAQAGFAILDHIADDLIRTTVPNPAGFEAAMSLSLVIFFDHPRDLRVLGPLQATWRKIIGKLLGLQEGGSQLGQLWRTFRNNQIFSIATAVLFRVLEGLPDYNAVSVKDLQAFYQLGTQEKALYCNLARYIDVHDDYSREQMEQDFLASLAVNDLLFVCVSLLALTTHLTYDPRGFLPFARIYSATAQNRPGHNPYIWTLPMPLTYALNKHMQLDELFDFTVETLEACHAYYKGLDHLPGLHYREKSWEAVHLNIYIVHQYRRTGTVRTPWLETRLQQALDRNDTAYFDSLIAIQLPLIGIEAREPRVALETLALVFDSHNEHVDALIKPFLARMRLFYPDEVDDFLEEHNAPEELRLYIRTHEPTDTVSTLIGTRSLTTLVDVVNDVDKLRGQIIQAFVKATEYNDVRPWVVYLLREVVNIIYGGEALPQRS